MTGSNARRIETQDPEPSFEAVCQATNAKRSGNHWKGTCPCHDDGTASLSISRGKKQAVVVRCHAGCDVRDIHAALKAKGAPIFPEKPLKQRPRKKEPRRVVAQYIYTDAQGKPVSRVLRFEPKDFVQNKCDTSGNWRPTMKGAQIVPYNLPAVAEAIANERPVFIVEGEKDADNLAKLGIVASCNAGGAGSFKAEHADHFKGADVILIPDNDEKGREHADSVGVSLQTLAKRIRLLDMPGLPPKGDISDWLSAGGAVETLWQLAEKAPEWGERASAVPKEIDYWNLPEWPAPVEAVELLDSLKATLEKYSILPPYAAVTITLWIVFAHAYNCFWISALLAIESPERRCGKSFLLDVIELLTPRPDVTGNISVSAAFRLCDEYHPTFIWDEVKRFLTADKSELIGLLESGYRRRSAWVRRTESEGRNFKVRKFSTWAPKVIALIGNIGEISDTLEDRSIRIRMRRKMRQESCDVIRQDRVEPFTDLNRQAARWASDNAKRLVATEPSIPSELHDRARDNWRPLLTIAHLAGGKWAKEAAEAALHISGISDSEEAGGALLLRHCKQIFEKAEVEQLRPTDLVAHLCLDEEWPWLHWRGGRDRITPRGVARLLAPYGIISIKSGQRVYKRESFEDAWRRYL